MDRTLLQDRWLLTSADDREGGSWEALNALFEDGRACFPLSRFPMQVHDVLLEQGVIRNPNEQGVNHDLWIHDRAWVYRCSFPAQAGLPSRLLLEGLDTFAQVWLNGCLLGCVQDAYLTWQWDVTEQLRKDNTLILFFHAPGPMVDAFVPPEKYQGLVPAISALRVFRTGYHAYCGPSPCLIRCGVYGEAVLLQADPLLLEDASARATLSDDLQTGSLRVWMRWAGAADRQMVHLSLLDEAGCTAAEAELPLRPGDMTAELRVENPFLWYPWTQGTPHVYTLLLEAGNVSRRMTVGFRSIRVSEDLAFTVNGRPFRPWGANLMHLDTLTNCYQPEKMERMLDMAVMANCSMLRVWGEGERLPQAFYDACDRRGILLWQDFFLGCSLYSEDEDFTRLCLKEAEQLVWSLRHHPSIALWCGGNEMYLARDDQHPEAQVFGEALFTQGFAGLCARLDPDRCYRPSSPCGGGWANDPSAGDTHGYTHLWFVPGRRYPAFLSENCRVSTPTLATMERMMAPAELWPEGYHGGVTRTHPYEWPETWNAHTTNEGWRKLGPVEHYPDAENPRELVYRVCMAHAEYIHTQVSRFRRGPLTGPSAPRTNGHLLWRLNDNSNVISFGVVDYFLQPGHAYYEMKRCYQPLMLGCAPDDHAVIFLVNDTPRDFAGQAEIFLYHLVENRVTRRMTLLAQAAAGTSRALCTLDDWGQFRKENIVCMRLYDEEGQEVCQAVQPCDIERRLPYPRDYALSLEAAEGGVIVAAARYARCVELTGDPEGDPFAWLFEDNFFDVIPGCPRFVRIRRGKPEGIIRARAAYDDRPAECLYQQKE